MDTNPGTLVTRDEEEETDQYGSDISIDSSIFARILDGTNTAITSAQTSFMQSEVIGETSDYGSDLDSEEEKELSQLIARIEGSRQGTGFELKQSELAEDDADASSRVLRIPRFLSSQDSGTTSIYYSALESLSQTSRHTTGLQPSQFAAQISHFNRKTTSDFARHL